MNFKLILVLVAFIAVSTSMAQTMVGPRAQASTTWYLNKNLSDNGDIIDYQNSFSYGYGLTIIQYLNETVGIEVGVGVHTMVQRTQGEFDLFSNELFEYETETSVQYLEVPILFKALSEGGAYFEVGPMFAFHQSEEESLLSSSPENEVFEEFFKDDDNRSDGFESMLIYGVIGFGVNFDLAKNLRAGVGLRIAYAFNDATIEYTEKEIEEDELELGWYSGIAHTDAPYSDGEYSYEPTTALQGAVNFGIYYVFGKIATAAAPSTP